MRAIVTRLMSGGMREKVLVSDWPEPVGPAANEFKTQTIYSGITNGTERNDLVGGNYANPDEALPAGWGYQNVGRVVAVGAEVGSVCMGDLVYLSADHMEYVVSAEGGLYVKLPRSLQSTHAALLGMASVAMRTCRNAEMEEGQKVLVVGAGCIGQFAAQICADMGARVVVCDVDERRLRLAREIGAAEQVIDVTGEAWDARIGKRTYDAIIDTAGVAGMEDKLISAIKVGGRVLLMAGRGTVSYTFNIGQWREATIKHNSHFDADDLTRACDLAERGAVEIGPLIQDVLPVTEAKRVYDTLRDEPQRLLGTVFVW